MESQNPELYKCKTDVQDDNFTCNTYKVTTCGNNVDPYLTKTFCIYGINGNHKHLDMVEMLQLNQQNSP